MKFAEPVALALAAIAFAAMLGSISVSSTNYAHRNGAREALADIAAGRPVKLYRHVANQIGPGSRTPGLYCPTGALKVTTVNIPEAGTSEGGSLDTWEKITEGEDARAFAYLYNMTMYAAHRDAWHRACPGLTVHPYSPRLY